MAAPRSSLLFDPDTHLEDALKIFMNSHRWKIHHTTTDKPNPKLNL